MVSDKVRLMRDECDNYDHTVISIISFSHLLRYDEKTGRLTGIIFFYGKKNGNNQKTIGSFRIKMSHLIL